VQESTKEHEAILRMSIDAKLVHAALEAAGAKPGTTAQFVNPKPARPSSSRPPDRRSRCSCHYKRTALHTHGAQEMDLEQQGEGVGEADWVFAGSQLPERSG